jgi:hypothetical protein
MNDDFVFVKTPSGEDAVRDRTRLVQRNLRMVLILVDGLTKVSALKQKAGDPSMIETALAELERIGLIESTETRGARQAYAVADALSSIPEKTPEAVPEELFHEVPTIDTVFEEIAPAPAAASIRAVDEAVLGVPSIQTGPPPTSHPSSTAEGWFSKLQKRWRHIQEERTYEKAYGTRRSEDDNIAPASPASRLTGRRRLKLKTILSLALLAGIVIGIARILFFPYDSYRPEVEKELSRIFGDTVRVERVSLDFSPLPKFMIRGIAVGAKSDAVIDEIALTPRLGYLLGGPFVQAARITGLHLTESAVGSLDKWLLRENMQSLSAEQIAVNNLSVDFGWVHLQGLAGILLIRNSNDLLFQGKFGDENSGGRFEVTPTAGGLRISTQSGPWTLPVDPPVSIDALDFSGRIEKGRLNIEKMDMRAFDGIVGGNGLVTWDNGTRMALDLKLKHVSAAKLLGALHAPILVDGELEGQVQYANGKPTPKWLASEAKASASVSVVRGSLKRIDLAGALKAASQQTYSFRGGDTGFEDFAGKVIFEAGAMTRVSDVRLSSGRLTATGQAIFPPDSGTVKGTANVEMRGSARAPRATITIGGNARDPELKVGPGYRPTTEPRVQEKPGEVEQPQ